MRANAAATVIPIEGLRRKRAKQKERNLRVRRVLQNEWQTGRMEKFRTSVRFSAAAKSYRTAMGVTQSEVAKRYRVTAQAVGRWESGSYFGWDPAELRSYCRAVNEIAAK